MPVAARAATTTNSASSPRSPGMALADRNRKLRRAFAGRPIPGDRHLARAGVGELDRPQVAAGRLVGLEGGAGDHRRHPRHRHAGVQRHLADIHRLLVLGRRELQGEVVLALLPWAGLALQRDDDVLGLLRGERLLCRPACGADSEHERERCHQYAQTLHRLCPPVMFSRYSFDSSEGRSPIRRAARSAVSARRSSRSRSQWKMTGVTIRTRPSELTMPPSTGVASGFMTSAPVEWLHMIGSKLATIVETVMTFGRRRSNAPSFTASRSAAGVSRPPSSSRFWATASSR